MRIHSRNVVLGVMAGMLFPAFVSSQHYTLQTGDKLSVSFWQEPELNTVATIREDGTIDLAAIGETAAAGLTASQLSREIVVQISRFRVNVTQVSVRLEDYGNRIYVTGQVRTPGAYAFEVIPDLWRVLQKAGGPQHNANLGQVALTRAGDHASQIIHVDLVKYFDRRNSVALPKLYRGDSVHVPRIDKVAIEASPPLPNTSTNEIYIFGEVASPGRYNLEKDNDLLDALVLAGGVTSSAKLSDVKLLTRSNGNDAFVRINLEEYRKGSEPGAVILYNGDRVFVPRKAGTSSSLLSRILVPIVMLGTLGIVVQALR